MLYVTLRHFSWLQQVAPSLCRWGRNGFTWKASRISMVVGALISINFGILVLGDQSDVLSQVMTVTFLVLMILALPLGWRDYRTDRYRKKKVFSEGYVHSLKEAFDDYKRAKQLLEQIEEEQGQRADKVNGGATVAKGAKRSKQKSRA